MPEVGGGTKDYRDVRGEISLVYATFPTLEAAQASTRPLVEHRLAACINLIAGMTAIYEWENAIHEDTEVVAIIKIRRAHANDVIGAIRASHPYQNLAYQNPAILVLDVTAALAPYLSWLLAQTARPQS